MARKPKAEQPVQEVETPVVETVETPVAEPVQKLDPGHMVEDRFRHLPAEKPEPEPEVEAPKIHKHSQRLLREATEFGIEQEVIDNTPSDTLDEIVYRLNRQAKQIIRDNQKAEQVDRVRDPERAPEPVKAPPTLAEELGFNEEEFTPELTGLVGKLYKKIKDQEARLEQVTGVVATSQQRSTADILDDAFASLGDKYLKCFGDQSGSDMTEDSPQLLRRNDALRYAGIDISRDTKKTILRKIKEAAEKRFGDLVEGPSPVAAPQNDAGPYAAGIGSASAQRPAQKPVPPKNEENGQFVKRWDEGGLARPTHRTEAVEPAGRTKAIRTVARIRAERDQAAAEENGTPEKFRV